ncbi:hypothetical protein EDB84DRAFT_1214657 [Lactarius hengduanensis]|nr:hypothetical protein EDB84DRAFT_1214657 [Lactarius hengduanensis]
MSAPLIPDVAEIAAPLLLGTVWNWMLYGVLMVQTYVYGYNFPDDGTPLKLLVYAVFLIETLQTALTGADLYYWFVSGFGNLEHLTSPYASPFDVPIIGSIVSLIVQFFFVYRIWVLSGRTSWLLCLVICLVSVFDAVAAIGGGVYVHVLQKFASGRILKILALTWLGGNTVADLVITGSMLYYLARRRGGYFSDHALYRIVILAIETNILTSKWTPGSDVLLASIQILPLATIGIVALVMVAVYPDKNWYTCPTAFLGKLYSNTLLVSLNNRISLRDAPTRAVGDGPPAVAVSVTSRPIILPGVVHLELEKPSAAFTARQSGDSSSTRVIDIA